MKKMTLQQDTQMTLADGCKKHYEYCRQRNLREGTLLHYVNSKVDRRNYNLKNQQLPKNECKYINNAYLKK